MEWINDRQNDRSKYVILLHMELVTTEYATYNRTRNMQQVDKEYWRKAASCRYWGLNDPFCCVHCNRDFQCISAPKIAPSHRGSRSLSNTWFFGPTESAPHLATLSVQLLLQSSPLCPTDRQTHRQAVHATCHNRSHPCGARDAA